MSPPLLLLFTGSDQRTGALVDEGQAQALRAYLASVPPGSVWRDRFYVGAEQQTEHGALDAVKRGEPLILLAVGPEGGATLARWVDAHGLDGVAGVGLVGVTAPSAEREECRCEGKALFGPCPHDRIPLGPLEPLRGVAERARVGEMTITDGSGSWPDGTPHEGGTAYRRAYPLRLVVACATNDGVCAACSGVGVVCKEHVPDDCDCEACDSCDGRGEALPSASVARELVGDPMLAVTPDVACYRDVYGGITTLQYESRAALAEHGLSDAVERLTR